MTTTPSCRVDIWLWRARFARTRSAAVAMIERGAVRLTHAGIQVRLDKPSRCVHVGDVLLFAIGSRVVEVGITDLGARRGSAEAARALYDPVSDPGTG